MKDIVALASRECKWPVGEGRPEQHLFCAKRTAEGMVYCAKHERLARAPTKVFPDVQALADRFAGGKSKVLRRDGNSDGEGVWALDTELALAESKINDGNIRLDKPKNEKWAG